MGKKKEGPAWGQVNVDVYGKCTGLVAQLWQALLYQRLPTSFESVDEGSP
jgi:hypothetical protein